MHPKYRIFLIAIVSLSFFCSDAQSITKISSFSGGGENGISTGLEITKDSTISYFKKFNEKQTFREKTNTIFWDSLTRGIVNEDLVAIKSNGSRTPMCLPDTSVKIKTDVEEYSFLNAEVDEYESKKMFDVLIMLGEKQLEIYSKYK